jgi:hypothetical protein
MPRIWAKDAPDQKTCSPLRDAPERNNRRAPSLSPEQAGDPQDVHAATANKKIPKKMPET